MSGGLPRALAGTGQRWGCRWLQGSGAGWTGGARGGHNWVGQKKRSQPDLVRPSCHFNKSPVGSQEATLTLGTGIRVWNGDGTPARSLLQWFLLLRILNPELPQGLSPLHHPTPPEGCASAEVPVTAEPLVAPTTPAGYGRRALGRPFHCFRSR